MGGDVWGGKKAKVSRRKRRDGKGSEGGENTTWQKVKGGNVTNQSPDVDRIACGANWVGEMVKSGIWSG